METPKGKLLALIPEINEIANGDLREKVVACWLAALTLGGWAPEDLLRLPASLRLADRDLRLLHHVRGVTQVALRTYQAFQTVYSGSSPRLDSDLLIAGAILHDVGKPIEFAEVNGAWQLSASGAFYRHPFTGAALVLQHNLPAVVVEIVAYHSTEGNEFPRSVEGTVVHLADALNFAPFFAPTKSPLGAEP
jgi:putative nucleotidyltransferase with HDIG domain